MTPERIAELRAIIAAAIKPPVCFDNYECAPGDLGQDRYAIFEIGEDDPALAYVGPWGDAEANAKMFVEVINSITPALDTIEAQQRRIEELEAALKPFASDELHEGLTMVPMIK